MVGIGYEASQEVNGEVDGTPVPDMFYPRDVLELVGDGLDNEALAQQEPVGQEHQLVSHVLAQRGDQL